MTCQTQTCCDASLRGYQGSISTTFQKLLGVTGRTLEDYRSWISAVAQVKKASALANEQIGLLDTEKAKAIVTACQEIIDGKLNGNFPISIYRSNGAPINAVVAEVVAKRASELSGHTTITIDDVNRSQAVADTCATARSIVVYNELAKLLESAEWFANLLEKKATEFKDVVKTGRISIRDSVPTKLGAEFNAWAQGVRRIMARIVSEQKEWTTSFFGAGELGTGLGIDNRFAHVANDVLATNLGRKLVLEVNTIEALGNADKLVLAHAHIQSLGVLYWHIARDLILLSSGPRCGIRETAFPAVAPGSSIMPGKINPTVAEMAATLADYVSANQLSVTMGVQSGLLGIGSISTLPIKAIMDSADVLARGMKVLGNKVISGLTAFPDRARQQAEKSLALVAVVEMVRGKEVAQKVLAYAQENNLTCAEACISEGIFTEEEAQELFNVETLANYQKASQVIAKYKSN
ncbi:MAG: lyase [Burkholderiaceae bacterium]|nr:lyase [Burkholderiaceae bacterium]